MDFQNVMAIITLLSQGGATGIVAMLVMAIFALLLDRRRLIAEITRKDDKIEKIVDDYYKGNTTLTEALNSLKTVLYEIKGKF